MKLFSKLVGVFSALGVVISASAGGHSHPVMVHRPWVQEAPPASKVNAAYMVFENGTGHPRVLVGASSPDFGKVEIHRSEIHDGMAHMVRQESVEIPAHGRIEFKPGGYHFMLMDASHGVRAGDQVRLMLDFADGSQIAADVEVRKTMGGMERPMQHNH